MTTLEATVLGRVIRVECQKLDQGWDIAVLGGDSTHIGAVTLAEPDGTEQTIERSGHKDSYVTRTWAIQLARAWKAPVCIRCGIHFDGLEEEQISTVLGVCDALLQRLGK